MNSLKVDFPSFTQPSWLLNFLQLTAPSEKSPQPEWVAVTPNEDEQPSIGLFLFMPGYVISNPGNNDPIMTVSPVRIVVEHYSDYALAVYQPAPNFVGQGHTQDEAIRDLFVTIAHEYHHYQVASDHELSVEAIKIKQLLLKQFKQ